MARELDEKTLEMIPSGQTTLEEAKEKFEHYNNVKGLRRTTLKNYDDGIDRFINYYTEHYPEAKYVGQIEKRDVEFYTLYLRNKIGMTDSSCNSYLRSIRSWLYYLMNEEQAVLPFKVQMVKADRKIKEYYTDHELRILTNRPNMSKVGFSEYRNWVIVNFLLATGVRASTLINVRVIDVDFDNGFITLDYTKSGKSYMIPLDKELELILKEYLHITEGEGIEPLFITTEGDALTYNGLRTAIERYNERLGVKKKGLHLFRHTFARIAIKNNLDVFKLQKLLGHADLSTSRLYVEMYSEDLKDDYEKYSPLSTLLNASPRIMPKKQRKISMSKLKG